MTTKVGLYRESQRKRPWLVCWRGDPHPDTGKQKKYTKSFKYRRDAEAYRAEKQAELNRGGARDKQADVSLGRLLKEFEEARLSPLSYSERRGYMSLMEQLREHFGHGRKLPSIETRHAETFMVTRKRLDGRDGKLSSWALAHHLRRCRAIFNAAVTWGYLPRNPFASPGRRGRSPLSIKGKSRPWHHITPSEFKRLLKVVSDVRCRAMYWLMCGCGLRPGEVYNLTSDRIDLERRRVHIEDRPATADLPPFTVKANDRTEDLKERSVPIPQAALPDIAAAVELAFKAGGFVALTPKRFEYIQAGWRNCRAGKPWGEHKQHHPWENRDMLNNILRNTKHYFRKAGIELSAPLTLNAFRKSFAQNHADHGTPPKTLAKLMGHSDVQTTMEFYARVTDANEKAAAETVDRLFATDFHCTSTGTGS